jgi:hypothetical protein
MLLFIMMMTPIVVAAADAAKGVKKGTCTKNGVHVIFRDGTQKDFPAGKDYKCSDFKISADHQYAGWKFTGTLTAESNGQKETYSDATVYVLVEGKSYAATNNSRYINDWFFVQGRPEVVAETAFEHGPSTYVLYDLQKRKTTETCAQFELAQCPRLQRLVKVIK